MNSCTFAKFNSNRVIGLRNGKVYRILDEFDDTYEVRDERGKCREFLKSYFSIPLTLYINE